MDRSAARDDDVRMHLYRRFVEDGRPPTVADTARALGLTEEEAAEAYRRLAEARVIVLEPGSLEVWMANPLSARETSFHVRVGDREYFGNCIWDGLGVVSMLGGDGTVSTTCPDCGEPLTLDVQGGEVRPAEAVAHFSVPASQWWEDIGHT